MYLFHSSKFISQSIIWTLHYLWSPSCYPTFLPYPVATRLTFQVEICFFTRPIFPSKTLRWNQSYYFPKAHKTNQWNASIEYPCSVCKYFVALILPRTGSSAQLGSVFGHDVDRMLRADPARSRRRGSWPGGVLRQSCTWTKRCVCDKMFLECRECVGDRFRGLKFSGWCWSRIWIVWSAMICYAGFSSMSLYLLQRYHGRYEYCFRDQVWGKIAAMWCHVLGRNKVRLEEYFTIWCVFSL